MTEEQTTKLYEFTRNYYHLEKDSNEIERYVDYLEEFPQSDIQKILDSENPQETFDEIVNEWNDNCDDWYYETEFKSKLENYCNDNNLDYDECYAEITENFYFCYPESFLNPSFHAVITINAGDMNYDYSLHNVLNYASSYGYTQGRNGTLDSKAGLYWLAKQQKKLGKLQNAIRKDEKPEDDKFVSSCIQELRECTTNLTALTFLVDMNLIDAINILTKLNELENNKAFSVYNPQLTKGYPFGYVTLDKDVTCGLYDGWNGGGSLLEIECDKDVKIPLHYIRRINTNNGIQKVYGLVEHLNWRTDVKKIA